MYILHNVPLLNYIILDKIWLAYLLLSVLFYCRSSIIFIYAAMLQLCCICRSISYLYVLLVFFTGKPLSRNVREKIKSNSLLFLISFLPKFILNFLFLVLISTFNEYILVLFSWIFQYIAERIMLLRNLCKFLFQPSILLIALNLARNWP